MIRLEAPPDEFRVRQHSARVIATDRNLAGLLVWSRAAGDPYWYGDVLYLANYHGAMRQVSDTALWTGRGHSVLVLPVAGEPTLVVDVPDPDVSVEVDDIRFTLHVPQTVAEVLREKGLDHDRIGLVGRDTLLASTLDRLEAAVGHELHLEDAEAVLREIRMVKSDHELELMRNAAAVGIECMGLMMEAASPGATDGSVAGDALRYLAQHDGYPFEIAITSGPSAHLYWKPSGPPHWDCARKLKHGDIFHIDLWGPVHGYMTDFARSGVVGGGAPRAEQREVLEATIGVVDAVVARVRAGVKVSELCDRGNAWLEENGWSGQGRTDHQSFGHGIGAGLDEPWLIDGNETALRERMVLAVEYMLVRGAVASIFEHNVVVETHGCEILDAGCADRWWQ
jgi:Xaa-Pro aminopeptidase